MPGKYISNKTIKNILLIISLGGMSLHAYAGKGAIQFSNNAFKQIMTTDKKGNKKIDYVKPDLVLPGDVILYQIKFKNISHQVVSNIVINNPVPNNSKYRSGSADSENSVVTFSVDGKHFKTAKRLTVTDKTGSSIIAKPEQYKAIRWVYKKSLKPDETAMVSYKTQIKK